jgi:transposase InsO family protein
MKLHRNARTCLHSRLLLIDRVERQGWSLARAAEAAGVSVRTVSKWLARYRTEGADGLVDRSSAPGSIPHRTSSERVEAIVLLRKLRMTAAEIAECLRMALSTVSAVLKRVGLGKRSRLEPPEPPNRYERRRAGELIHIDVKKLVRIRGAGHRVTGNRRGTATGIGWEYVHVCVDDATRLAYVEVLNDEKAVTAIGFLRRAIAHFRSYGIQIKAVMTDNGGCYRSNAHKLACTALRIKHLRTRPYRPRTNGKAERFIRTMLDGWAYGAIYATSDERTRALTGWLDFYNRKRPHSALSHQPPLTRLEALKKEQPA